MGKEIKNTKELERHFKGIANHRRIEILFLIGRSKGVSLEEISEALNCNFKTTSEHTRRLEQAGLINKRYQGRRVIHSLSNYGRAIYRFIEEFKKI